MPHSVQPIKIRRSPKQLPKSIGCHQQLHCHCCCCSYCCSASSSNTNANPASASAQAVAAQPRQHGVATSGGAVVAGVTGAAEAAAMPLHHHCPAIIQTRLVLLSQFSYMWQMFLLGKSKSCGGGGVWVRLCRRVTLFGNYYLCMVFAANNRAPGSLMRVDYIGGWP